MLTVTDKAAEKIKELLTKEQKALDKFGLRLGVMGGGCSGLQYRMEFDTQREDDHVIKADGVQVFVDTKSLEYVDGSQLDYIDSLTGAGFKVGNPKETGSCGCGQSFSV